MNELFDSKIFWYLAGILSSFLVARISRKFSLRDDEVAKLSDGLIEDIDLLAELGCEYWLSDANEKEKKKTESRITGVSHRIGANLNFITEDQWFFKFHVEEELISLRDAVTGGNFGSSANSFDPTRCQLIQKCATDMILKVRECRRIFIRGWF